MPDAAPVIPLAPPVALVAPPESVDLTFPTLSGVIEQAHRGIERVRGTSHLAYGFLRHAGLSVSSLS